MASYSTSEDFRLFHQLAHQNQSLGGSLLLDSGIEREVQQPEANKYFAPSFSSSQTTQAQSQDSQNYDQYTGTFCDSVLKNDQKVQQEDIIACENTDGGATNTNDIDDVTHQTASAWNNEESLSQITAPMTPKISKISPSSVCTTEK